MSSRGEYKKLKSEDEPRPLPRGLVHNSRQQAHFIFGKENDAGGGESIELEDLNKRPQRRARFLSEGQDDEDQEETFVVHEVESHHTLRGIALQYKSTVDQIKRLNNLWTDNDLHSRKTIKIPVVRNGILYEKFHSHAADSDEESPAGAAKTHTTRRMVRPHQPPPTLRVAALPPPAAAAEEDLSSSSEYLNKLDRQLNSVIAAQKKLLESSTLPTAVVVVPATHSVERDNTVLGNLTKDWRLVLFCAVCLIVGLPTAWVVLVELHRHR
eukprot:m.243650 g.243650  ORF g.243650 m.243650 type:complete len:269 (+) comp28187_c0_seq1:51-857(+)